MGLTRSSAAMSTVAVLAAAAVILMAGGAEARPLYDSMRSTLPPVESAIFSLPYLDNGALRAEADEAAANRTIPGPFKFGVEQPLNDIDILAAGEVTQVPCQSAPSDPLCRDKVYRFDIVSKGAMAMQLTFSKMVLCETCQVLVYPADEALAAENTIAFTSSAHGRAPPRSDLVAETPLLPGDSLIVEVYVSTGEQAVVIASNVVHSFRDVFQLMADSQKVFGVSSTRPCENNVNCYSAYSDEKKAVALITVGGGLCTGSLLNNGYGSRQIFLTASHCLESNLNSGTGFISSGTLNNIGFYFNGETFSCSTNSGPSAGSLDFVSGAALLGNEPYLGGIDYALLQITQTIPSSFGVYYLGWDSSTSLPSTAYGIHHPGGDYKKISFGGSLIISGYGGVFNQIGIRWTDGVTAGGSSGSPLLSSTTDRVIGQLRGGSSSCQNPNGRDYYGRLALSYNSGMKSGLVGSSSSITSMDGTYNPSSSGGGGGGGGCVDEADLPSQYPCFSNSACGGNVGACYCDPFCTSYNDCCSDYTTTCVQSSPPTVCPTCVPESQLQADYQCYSFCGGQAPESCYCDPPCTSYNDCCSDYSEVCVQQSIPPAC